MMQVIKKIYEIKFLNLADIKNYLRVQHDEDDILIQSQINAATEYAEKFLSIHLVKKDIEIQYNGSIPYIFKIAVYPIKKFGSLRYRLGAEEYELKQGEDFEFNHFVEQVSMRKKYQADFFCVDLEVGLDEYVPYNITQGIMKHIAKLYNNSPLDQVFQEVTPFYQSYRRYSL